MARVLEGRAAIVTGGTRGLGLEIARAYLAEGARVAICGRDRDQLANARAELGDVVTVAADVARADDVERVVAEALEAFGSVEVLVNNAGVYGPIGPVEELDWTEWTRALEVNLLGSVLMARALLPHFKQRGYGKIVQLSGGGATAPLPRFTAYAASKAAAVRFAETLAEEVRVHGIDVNSIAPGALNTRLLDQALDAGPDAAGASFYERAVEQKEHGGTPTAAGAELAVFLASAASDGITGKLLSAVWDPWGDLDGHVAELRDSDVYTLRRIVPEDRGLTW
jgi:NAD(P)-dependent dehydrogenase (short-subunit alcohol dehydrogenase family)